ncbi:MAG TPA: biotin carboxylase N-terminal domain-containing protein [Planctomycetota bacterium]|nr:biotin carboxylase N-terminal domain-containing protein [Planctomycetota bacterium]
MAPPFRRVLIANRGEIAVRICRGLRELGIESVAVHSEVDRRCAHVLAADLAFPLGGNTAAESYLDIGKILAAAKATGAVAIHPGYGFLSENAAFARAVRTAGLTFIGPNPEAMDRLGSKQSARAAALQAAVPVVPGTDQDLGDAALIAAAKQIGLPVMVKASAGGGGRGMRAVAREADLAAAIAASRREAKAAFGDDRMIVEQAVFPARHVEIQLLGDQHGNVVSLHERECSVQRRHQKVLEESPSPAVDELLRQRMGDAAVRLARSVGYDNAGTAEFLLDERGQFYFLEVNARLQVEHPVTELVTGTDLVHLQLHIAAGARLTDLLAGRDLRPRGHALEARICAEAPEQGYRPAAGLLRFVQQATGPGVRVDSGVYSGWEVPPFYDSMLAKLVVHAPDRATACVRMSQALRDSIYLGIDTNVDFLRRIVDDPDFRAGRLRTDFIDRKPQLTSGTAAASDLALAAAVLCQAVAPARNGTAGGGTGATAGPRTLAVWQQLPGLRLWQTTP